MRTIEVPVSLDERSEEENLKGMLAPVCGRSWAFRLSLTALYGARIVFEKPWKDYEPFSLIVVALCIATYFLLPRWKSFSEVAYRSALRTPQPVYRRWFVLLPVAAALYGLGFLIGPPIDTYFKWSAGVVMVHYAMLPSV